MIFFRASEAFSLGLERTGGFETVAFCEIEDYPRRVLAKHWPHVPCYDDVRTLTADALSRDGIAVDVICGGFPCQDISFAGKGAGLAGERSGLWREYARLIGELRPRYVIVENVAALLGRGLRDVLGDMATLGYDAEWHCIPAAAVGAPHRRDRLWIIAYSGSQQHESDSAPIGREIASQLHAADTTGDGWAVCWCGHSEHDSAASCSEWFRHEPSRDGAGDGETAMADTECTGLEGHDGGQLAGRRRKRIATDTRPSRPYVAHAFGDGRRENVVTVEGQARGRQEARQSSGCMPIGARQWGVEPSVRRVADGVPYRVDRLKGLGNAVVPQVPFIIGRAILKAEGLTQ